MTRHWTSFDLAASTATPWRNGGGTTCELFTLGGDASHAFDARVSVATIARPGPFSAFPDIDRQITLIDGPGVRLTAVDGAFDHTLDHALHPFAFDGAVALDATSIGGRDTSATRVINVMTRRRHCRADVTIAHTACDVDGDRPALLFVARGMWGADRLDTAAPPDGTFAPAHRWIAGQGAFTHGAAASASAWRLRPISPDAALFAVVFTPSSST